MRLDDKNTLKHKDNSPKQLKIATSNGPWACTWKGLLSERYLRLRFRGLIFGRASDFGRGLLSEFYGGTLMGLALMV